MVETLEQHACFGGIQGVYAHDSAATGTRMTFALFAPPADRPVCGVLYYLSGLTCTWENVTIKAGAQRAAAEQGMMFVAPDTSPRGEGVPDDPAVDFGQGASFYVDATESPWSQHFRMEHYLSSELPALVDEHFGARGVPAAITGHSMGGHGALTLAMRHPQRFRSASALSPIVNPSEVPWGQKAFAGYLGDDRAAWRAHDACALVRDRGWARTFLVDQGEADGFLGTQLQPEAFERACAETGTGLTLRRHTGYDHSYYFVATFIGDHIAFHAVCLRGQGA
jgi:S-formylglutathione hydrolase